jgi:hypothetical protein
VSVIVNPRGAGGAGKTELVRRVLAGYGWRRCGPLAADVEIEMLCPDGRSRPMGLRIGHPHGLRPLAVVGDYGVTSGGGCDSIRRADGGLPVAVALARDAAAAGHDVLIEGFQLSREYRLSAALADAGRLHVLRLATSPERCARNLVARRRLRRDAWEALAKRAAVQAGEVAEACTHLPAGAQVEALAFDAALLRARRLLGLCPPERQADGAGPALAGPSAQASAAFARSTMAPNAAGSCTARSASTLRSTSMPARSRPLMKRE